MAHFSKEELQEISNYLIKQGVKDSEFQITQDVRGEVFVAIVKSGKNYRISIGNFADGVLSLTMDEILMRVDALIQASEDKLTTIFEGEIEFTAQHLQTKFSEEIVDATGVLEHEFNTKIEQTAREISMQAEENLRNTAEGLEEDYNSKISITARQIRSDVDAEIRQTEQQITENYHSEISQTAQQIRTQVDKEITDTANELNSEFHSEISQTAEEIRTEVTREITDATGATLDAARSYTEQTADRITQGVEQAITDSENQTKSELRSELNQTASEITATVEANKEEADGSIQELQGQLTVQAGLIATKVSQTDYDADKTLTEEHFSEIEQTAEQIQSTVAANKAEADGQFIEQQSQITQQAGLLSQKVEQTEYDANKTEVDSSFSLVEQTAEQIQSTVEHNKQVDDERYLEQQSQITQQAGLIATKVSEAEYDSDKVLTNARMSAIEQTSEQIQLQVTENRQVEDGHYQSTQSQITEQASQIASKVSQDEFDAYEGRVSNKFSQIEQTEAGITATVEQHTSQLSSQASTLTEYYNWLSSLQTQVDQEIDTWFENYPPVTVDSHGVPTSTTPLMVSPYSDWYNAETPDDPEAVRERHVEDVFYDNSTGYGFRFSATGNKGSRVYEWVLITDSAVIAALAAAAAAQATADGKIRAFLTTPTAPYSYGDLWIKDVKLYPGTASEVTLKQTFTCSRAEGRAEGTVITPEMLAADWEPVEDYAIEVAKANLQILANATINYATQFTYNADGTISDTTSGAITTAAGQIRLQVANGAIDTAVGPNGKITTPLLGTGIDIVNGEITLIANKISLKNQNDVTGLALTTIGTSPNQKVVIDVSSLNVSGIFSTTPGSVWATEKSGLEQYADGKASDAQTAAENTAARQLSDALYGSGGSSSSVTGGVYGSLNPLTAALSQNSTVIAGGLMLSTALVLGSNTGTGGAWQAWSGLYGVYNSAAGAGGGIAAWYGGTDVDAFTISGWDSMTPAQKEAAWTSYRYARSLFRHDGSGYLANGEISWSSTGSVAIHGATLYDSSNNQISISDLITLKSWFTTTPVVVNGTTYYALKLVTGNTPGSIIGFCTEGFVTAGGVGSGGGGGGTGLDVTAMYANLANATGTDSTYWTREINVSHLHEFWKSLQNNDIVSTYDNYKIHVNHIPDMAETYGYLKSVDIDAYLQSLQSQIDSVASRSDFDELVATTIFGDQISASSGYIENIFGALSGNATTASYLSSSTYAKGGEKNPVYFSGGLAVASTTTEGSATVPVYLNAGTITACTGSSVFSSLSSSAATNLSATIAGYTRTATLYATYDSASENIADKFTIVSSALQSLQSQVDSVATKHCFDELLASYVASDTICATSLYGELNGNAYTSSYLVGTSYGVGSATLPVYFSGGRPVACTASSLFGSLSSSAGTNLSITIAGQNRTATLYATYNSAGENISDKFSIISTTIQSLQSQIDSVAAKISSDEVYAGYGYFDMLSIGSAIGGNLSVIGTIYSNVGIYSSGYVTAGAAASSSDARLKEHISAISYEKALDILLRFRGCEWDWNGKKEYLAGKHGSGLIAQEVQGIMPWAVLDLNGEYSLNYNSLWGIAIPVIQNHEQRIKELKAEVEKLKNNL